MRKRMLARTYQPKFFSNMAVGVPEGRCTKTFLAAVSFSSGNGLFYSCRCGARLKQALIQVSKKKGKPMDNSKPLPRLLKRAHDDGSLYGIMGGDVIRRAKIKRCRIATWLTCLSLVVSLCLLPGIMVGERASAQSTRRASKVSSDLSAKAHSLTN